jgi:hypothetical protein
VSHLFDRSLKISVEWHQETIFLAHDLFFVEQFLHCFVVSLFSVEGESLKFHLVLSIVQDCLWQKDVGGDCVVQITKLWPSSGIDCHGIKLVSILKSSLALLDVFFMHGVDQFVLSLLECIELLLGHEPDVADLCPPPLHIYIVLLNPLILEIKQELILNLCLSIPVVISVLEPGFTY